MLCQFTGAGTDKETLASFNFPKDVYSIGRLDYDSEGLLILTDDPSMNQALLSPERRHRRTYLVQVENIPLDSQLKLLEHGVVVEGEPTLPASAALLASEPRLPPRPVPIRTRKHIPTAWIKLTLTEGRNRQVRKMTAAVGCPTLRLVRVAIGNLFLDDLNLPPGKWKLIDHSQVALLFE